MMSFDVFSCPVSHATFLAGHERNCEDMRLAEVPEG
jgi:hypothetical protein